MGCSDGTVRIYDMKQEKLRHEVVSSDSYDSCVSLRYKAKEYLKSKVIVTASSDGTISQYHS